jgi:hypothetical protein
MAVTIVACLVMFAATYYFAAVIQTVLHRVFGHRDRIHRVYVVHAQGHHAKYPPHRLKTDAWIDSEQHVMWYYAIPLVPVALAIAWLGEFWLFLSHAASLAFAIWWHIYLHKQYHLRATHWERFAWFRRKRELHFIHHRHVHSNFAIVEYWIDRCLGTRKEPSTSERCRQRKRQATNALHRCLRAFTLRSLRC